MKINHSLLLCLTAIVLFGSSCSDSDPEPGAGNLVIGDKNRIMRSGALGFSAAPLKDAEGNTYYVHSLMFMDYGKYPSHRIVWSTTVFLQVTSPSPTSLPDGEYVTRTDNVRAGQIYACGFSVDAVSGERPEQYSGYSYGLVNGSATLSVVGNTIKLNLDGTVAGNSEKTRNQTAEATLSYDGTWGEMYVVD